MTRFGLEGLIRVDELGVQIEYSGERYGLSVGKAKIAVFDKVTVSVEAVKEENTAKLKVKMELLKPEIR
jgi:S1 domain